MVSSMNEPPNRYDVTVTVPKDGGYLPDSAESAMGAERAASSRVVLPKSPGPSGPTRHGKLE